MASGVEAAGPAAWGSRRLGQVETPPPQKIGELGAALWSSGCGDGVTPDTLHPVVREARVHSIKASLIVGDVFKSSTLAEHFERYSLGDFFDERGQRRFQNLSMSVAAKRHVEVAGSFGSVSLTKPSPREMPGGRSKLSARAYRLATEVVERDRESIRERNSAQFRSLTDEQKVRVEEVQQRQQDMFFLELPDGEFCLPRGCTLASILQDTLPRDKERDDKRRLDRLNKDLLEGGFASIQSFHTQGFALQYEDVLEVVSLVGEWVAAGGLPFSLGVDRSTFCRFILDLELVDQERVPYVWAVSLFDARACWVRAFAGDLDYCDPLLENRTPVTPLISKWDFITIVDRLLRRRSPNRIDKQAFMSKLQAVHETLKAAWLRQDAREREEHNEADSPPAGGYDAAKTIHSATAGSTLSVTANGQPRRIATFATMGQSLEKGAAQTSEVAASPDGATWKRDRRIAGLLVEPEVLRLIEQYRGLFCKLFKLYARGDGSMDALAGPGEDVEGMDYARLLQFCEDFRIVPRLASRYEVLRAYRAVECLELRRKPTHLRPEDAEEQQARPPPASPPVERKNVGRSSGKRFQPVVGKGAADGAQPERRPPSARRRGSGLGSFKKRHSLVSPQRAAADAARPHGAPEHADHKAGQAQRKDVEAVLAADASAAPAAASEAERTHGRAVDHATVFGPAAFTEALCRIVCSYLLASGNLVQLSTPSHGKIAWFVAYLHAVLVGLHRSQGRRQQFPAVRHEDAARIAAVATADAAARPQSHQGPRANQLQLQEAPALPQTPPPILGPPPSMAKRSDLLAAALNELAPAAFMEPTPPELQRPATPPTRSAPEALVAAWERKTKAGAAGSQRASAENPLRLPVRGWKELRRTAADSSGQINAERLKEALGPEGEDSPGMLNEDRANPLGGSECDWVSEASTPTEGGRKRKAEARRRMREAKLRERLSEGQREKPVERIVAKESPPPKDAFRIEDLLFGRLLRGSAVLLCEAQEREQARAAAEAAAARHAAPPSARSHQKSPRGQRPHASRPPSPATSATSRTERREGGGADVEHDVLVRELVGMGNRIERNTLTPPPANPFAIRLDDRLQRMLHAKAEHESKCAGAFAKHGKRK